MLGAVSGAHAGLCSAFEMAGFVVSLLMPRPSQFPVLMAGSLASVGAAAALFWWWHAALPSGPGWLQAGPEQTNAADASEE